jgi:hypothetical protein
MLPAFTAGWPPPALAKTPAPGFLFFRVISLGEGPDSSHIRHHDLSLLRQIFDSEEYPMIRFHYALVALAVAAGLGLSAPARATIQDEDAMRLPAASQGMAEAAIVVADNYKKDWNKNKNWKKGDNWKYNNNKNWSNNNNYKYNNKNWNKNWNNNWANYNNNWNKNWNNRAYVRNWNHRPYYGQFVGGVVLGSILAATGVGIVPYAPQPNLCWYWADPYMYRGYWDYCY